MWGAEARTRLLRREALVWGARLYISGLLRTPMQCNREQRRDRGGMGRPETRRSWCKRHPKHPQSTGVCPFCLRERLSRLSQCSSSSSSFVAYISSPWAHSSSSSSGSDNPSSSASSPPRHRDVKRARVSFLLKRDTAASSALMKSRSLVVVVGSREDEEKEKETDVGKGKQKEKVEKKDKFWSWLLSGSKRRQKKEGNGDSLRPQTFKEKPSAKWILFS